MTELSLIAVAFDVHLAEILTPWMLGFATATAPRNELLEDLAFGIELIGVTHICCVPSLIEATFSEMKSDVGKIKYLISGGEKITDNVGNR
jgi:ferricrocin synthase